MAALTLVFVASGQTMRGTSEKGPTINDGPLQIQKLVTVKEGSCAWVLCAVLLGSP